MRVTQATRIYVFGAAPVSQLCCGTFQDTALHFDGGSVKADPLEQTYWALTCTARHAGQHCHGAFLAQ